MCDASTVTTYSLCMMTLLLHCCHSHHHRRRHHHCLCFSHCRLIAASLSDAATAVFVPSAVSTTVFTAAAAALWLIVACPHHCYYSCCHCHGHCCCCPHCFRRRQHHYRCLCCHSMPSPTGRAVLAEDGDVNAMVNCCSCRGDGKVYLVLLYLTPSLIRSLSYQCICGFVHLSSVCQQRENQKNTEDTIQQKMSATVLL
jgi:hypothetical protein